MADDGATGDIGQIRHDGLDADGLLSGPRGRRVCLELLRESDDELGTAVAKAAWSLEPVRSGRTSRGAIRLTALVELLRRRPLGGLDGMLTDDKLRDALEAAVDAARYWQEPDGEDLLAAQPEVRAALRPVARRVLGASGSSWWLAPMDPKGQYLVAFPGWRNPDGAPSTPTVDAPAPVLEDWYRCTVDDEQRSRRDGREDPRAAVSGVWWSVPQRLSRTTHRVPGGGGPAELWLDEDSFGPDSAASIPVAVAPGARVWEVDGPQAWADLCRRHPLDVTASRRHDWYRTTGRAQGRWVVPDWRALAADVDGVHLSVAGYLRTAGVAVEVGDDAASVVAGWNPDATLWLTDVITAAGPQETWDLRGRRP